ncbi:MAG: hypothetical protein ACOC6F_02335 [bacterium]
MGGAEGTERILEQRKALVRAIELLDTVEPGGPIEEVMTWLLLKAYRRCLRAIVASTAAWVCGEILSASERSGDDRPVLWMSEN